MRRGTLFFFALFTASLAPAAELAPASLDLTLVQALELARRQNVDIALALLAQQTFESQYWQVFGGALPTMSLTATYTRNVRKPVAFLEGAKLPVGQKHGLDVTLTGTQVLYSGGKVRTAIAAADKQRAVGQAVTQATQEDVFLAVKRLFYGGLLAREAASIQEDNLNSTENHLRTIKERYRQGLDSDLTVRRQDVEVANARTLVIQAKNLHEMTLATLQEVLALDVDRPIRLIGNLAPPKVSSATYASYVQSALAKRPELQAARLKSQVASDLIRIAKADYQPTLGAFASIDWTAQSRTLSPEPYERDTSLLAGLQLKHDFFSGGLTFYRVRQAKEEYEEALQEQSQTERAIRVEVKKQWLAVKEALERTQAQETAVAEARRALEATEVRYRTGHSNQLELNDATFALNRARTDYSQASHDFWVSLAALQRAAGIHSEEKP